MIRFTNVNKKFDNKIVLEDINITFEDGSIIGLVGKNGSGKSTLLRLISGVLHADAGVVLINDQLVYDNPETKKDLFFVGDDPFFFSQSTIKDMQQFYKVFYKSFDDNYYRELLSLFGLDENRKINALSKGMKRQVSLLLALASKPKILLLDEAFDGFDPIMRFRIKQLLGEMILDHNSTVIISSHNLRELEDICDTVAIIDENNIMMNQSTNDFGSIYHRYQIAFDVETKISDFDFMNPLNVTGSARIFSIILKGDREKIEADLNSMNPLLIEHNDVTLEEIFIYEMENKNHENID
ncbi:ABC transporter ATP-binding protein [Erysipelothrix rhusiopathiae]|nr:ABC transporter ATP-binding protein [Erysipelothrix rhusiopathiae]MDE8077455.1 ABC transporter ATP-binding protein [Erysipelothrix rhusiopathiae]MDE8149962.1 ABC transporter ATP-binding protein [Erysipelothrix rhusiopathiae]